MPDFSETSKLVDCFYLFMGPDPGVTNKKSPAHGWAF
jgi:hypothetical protein